MRKFILTQNRSERLSQTLASVLQDYRRSFSNIALLTATLFLLLLTLEVILRLWPAEILGQEFVTAVLHKYTTAPDGIYYYDPALKMHFMKPNFKTDQYWNGYRWRHETDGLGFRNVQTRMRGDVILLGDSMIYGHGANIGETVGVLLEQFIPYAVINLGTQGHCAFQEMYLVHEYVPKLKPQYIIYFFFENDISDLYAILTDEEMSNFIQRNVSEITFRPRTDPKTLIRHASFFGLFPPKLYLFRAFDMLKFKLRKQRQHEKPVAIDAVPDVNNEDTIGWKYTKQAILYMDAVAKSHQAKLIIVPITNKSYYGILKKFAAQHGLLFAEKSDVYTWGPTHFFPGDGHFNAAGATRMAKIVADYLKDQS
ncbi:MAG: SGNH/GDSL hydrolase family protein [Nitrospiraceae bacterium]